MRLWYKVLRLILLMIFVLYTFRSFQLHLLVPTRHGFAREEHQYSFYSASQLIRSNNETRHQLILRALIIFYPDDQERLYLPELRWFYWSWIAMMNSGESKTWRTDLIIFTGNFTNNLKKLGCKFNQRRVNRFERPDCRVFHYVRLAARTKTTNSNQTQANWSSIINEKFKNYRYVDSLNVIVEGYPIFMIYDFILKTDLDVFLTRYFASDLPITRKTLLTGRGGYSVSFNINRLRRIAHDIGWRYANLSNIGSTWYGPPNIARRIGNFSLQAMVHLYDNEFTRAERQGKLGTKQWPDWHYGVLSMYGAHLAVNHLVLKERIDVRIANKLLDQSIKSKSLNEIDIHRILHLHCWHVHVPFSKFDFKKNQYDHIDPKTLLNDTSPRAFAMRIALESKKLSLEQLAEQLLMVNKS